jgi:deoxyribodipyrimidine photo-lyase
MSYALVWFKRDLRWQDHEALANASQNGPVRCIYIVEPELWRQPDCALQHFEFIRESLLEVDTFLRSRGGCIEVHAGEAADVLAQLWDESPFSKL